MYIILSQKIDCKPTYKDIPFCTYHYPARYRNAIHIGDRFVYSQGNRYDKSQRYYFGTGIVGAILQEDSENYRCSGKLTKSQRTLCQTNLAGYGCKVW